MSESLEEICQIELPTGEEVGVVRRRFSGGPGPHVAIVAAVRGDTPEGTRVAHAVARHLRANHERLTGTVDVYPCVNPLAAHHGARNWPGFDLDLNRRFPGRPDGHAPDRVAYAMIQALRHADQVVELRGAHPAFREETQAHVRADSAVAIERAMHANVRVVWKRGSDIEGTGTLASQIPGMICLEGGRGNRLTEGVGNELCDGVLNLLVVLKVLPEDNLPFHWAAIQRPFVATDDDVVRVRATRGGLFLPLGKAWAEVQAGDPLGEVVDPIGGEAREAVVAPIAGRVLALREQPVVYPGSLVARIVGAP
ncbi:MAG: succinylglutamate desuccinylase/aspartoacylase family protein [Myxococcota bacterium]